VVVLLMLLLLLLPRDADKNCELEAVENDDAGNSLEAEAT
jgi:hypothetical protein